MAEDIEIDPTFSYENRYMVNQKRYGGKGFVEKKLLIYLATLKNPVKIQVTEHDGYRWFSWNPRIAFRI